jgi:hypothetical protein
MLFKVVGGNIVSYLTWVFQNLHGLSVEVARDVARHWQEAEFCAFSGDEWH